MLCFYKKLSKLDIFTTFWCCIQNILVNFTFYKCYFKKKMKILYFFLFFNFEVLNGIKKCFLAKIEEKTSFLTKNFFCFFAKKCTKDYKWIKTRKNVFLKWIFKMAFTEIGIKYFFVYKLKKIVKLSNFDSFSYKKLFLNC